MSTPLRGGEPDAALLAELAGPGPVRKMPPGDPVMGLTLPAPARPVVVPVVAAATEPAAPPEADVEQEAGKELKKKIGGWNGYPSNFERIRAAWYYTQTHPEGWPSMSEMTESVLLAEAKRLEKVANGGERFPPVPPGKVKRGK